MINKLRRFLAGIILVAISPSFAFGIEPVDLFRFFTGSSVVIFDAPYTSDLLLAKGTGSPTATRASNAYYLDHEGLHTQAKTNDLPIVGARRVENLAASLVTQNITVQVGDVFQVVVAGTNESTCVASDAFTGTLTANGTNYTSWASGTPKTATTQTLTLTVTGTLTALHVTKVTGQANQNPSSPLAAGVVSYYSYANGNTVDGSGIVTEAQGAALTGIQGVYTNPAAITNKISGYSAIGPDMLGSELASGTLTIGRRYQITAYTDLDFTTAGAANNNVGTQFTATAALTLDAGDKVKEIGAANLSDGTFVSGFGTGAAASYVGTWSQPFPSSTAAGGTDDQSSIVITTDATNIAAAKLQRVLPGSKVRNIINTGASAATTLTFTGTTGNTNAHTVTAWIWGSGNVQIGTDGALGTAYAATSTPTLVSRTVTPATSSDVFQISTAAGADIKFTCPMLIEGSMTPPLVVSQGAATAQALTALSYPLANNYNPASGTMTMTWTPQFNAENAADGSHGIISFNGSGNSALYWYKSGTTYQLRAYDGTNTASLSFAPVKGETCKIGLRWNTAALKMQLSVSGGGVAESTFDGAFAAGSSLVVGAGASTPFSISDVKIYSRDLGTARLNALTSDQRLVDTGVGGAFTFTGADTTFDPTITTTGSPTILWTFADGSTSSSANPGTKTFQTKQYRNHSLTVNNWALVTQVDFNTDGISRINLPLASLTALTLFYAYDNQLTGSIPSLSANTALANFSVHTNQLTGSIPSLSANTALITFFVHNNQLTGTIPSFSANTALATFYAYTNQLTGSIPSLTANTALANFQVNNNQLTGSIPSLTANTALATFYAYDNQLTGSIPSLSANTALITFFVHNNQLTGTIPSFSANTALTTLYLHSNQLTGWTGGTVSASLGNARFDGNPLTQTAVDAILAAFDAAGRTSASGACILNIGGTGPATPSAAGLVSKANLVAKGWTVTTN